MELKLLYVPDNAITGHLLQDLLAAEGIDAHLEGEFLQGGIGELPPLGVVRLMVADDDWQSANQIIQDWEAGAYSLQEPRPDSNN